MSDVLRADITAYRGTTADVSLLDREPQPGQVTSETSDAALGTTTLAFANGTRVVLKPTDFKNDEVLWVEYGWRSVGRKSQHADFQINQV